MRRTHNPTRQRNIFVNNLQCIPNHSIHTRALGENNNGHKKTAKCSQLESKGLTADNRWQ